MWDLEGKTVTGRYLGQYPYRGTVDYSRVALGGRVVHSVTLEKPILVRRNIRYSILIDSDETFAVEESATA